MGYTWFNELGQIIVDIAVENPKVGGFSVERTILHFPRTAAGDPDDRLTHDIKVYWGMAPLNRDFFYANPWTRLYVDMVQHSDKVLIESFSKETFEKQTFTHAVTVMETMGSLRTGIYQLAFPKNCRPVSVRMNDDTKLVHADIYNNEYIVMTWLFNGELELLTVGNVYGAQKKIDRSSLYALPEFSAGMDFTKIGSNFKKVSSDPSVIKSLLDLISKLF
jgi:hypothetical protein